jgi:uncharacterized protein (TIGR02646 family)
MRFIKKNNEPSKLTRFREQFQKGENEGYSQFSNEQGKTETIEALLEEQGHLCAYCMRYVYTEKAPITQIEHWEAQSNDPLKQLDYSNMLGVCSGRISWTDETQTTTTTTFCEDVRGNTPLMINPLNINLIEEIKFTEQGVIYSDNEVINKDLDETLQLNIGIIKQNRAQIWLSVKKEISKHNTPKEIEKQLYYWQSKHPKDGKQKYKEYSQVAIYLLKKELIRANKNVNKFHK